MRHWLGSRLWAAAAIAALAAAFGALHGCGGGGGSSSSGPPATVTINTKNDAAAPMGFSFDSPVTVSSGTVVKWSNTSSAPHNIAWDTWSPGTSPSPGANIATFGAGNMSTPWTAPTVTTMTTYNYHCAIHGPTMAGIINVTP